MRGLVWILCSTLLLMPVTQAMAVCCLNPAALIPPGAAAPHAEQPCHPGMAMSAETTMESEMTSVEGDAVSVTAMDCPHGGHCAAGGVLLPGVAPQPPSSDAVAAVFSPPLAKLAAGWPLSLLRPPQTHS